MSDYDIVVQGDVMTLAMRGQITYEISPEMKRELETRMEKDQIRHVRVDMSETTFLDSHGIGILVMLHKLTSEPGRDLRIARPSQESLKILDLVGLLAIFTLEEEG